MSDVAWRSRTFHTYALHRLVYLDVRERSGMSALVTVRCLAKVADACTLDQCCALAIGRVWAASI